MLQVRPRNDPVMSPHDNRFHIPIRINDLTTDRSIPHTNQDTRPCPQNDRFHIQSVNLIDRSTLVYTYIGPMAPESVHFDNFLSFSLIFFHFLSVPLIFLYFLSFSFIFFHFLSLSLISFHAPTQTNQPFGIAFLA